MIIPGKRRTLTGAWIETDNRAENLEWVEVAPLRVRGLKLPHGGRWTVRDDRIVDIS